jgi:hypothetical protein
MQTICPYLKYNCMLLTQKKENHFLYFFKECISGPYNIIWVFYHFAYVTHSS